MTQSIEKILSKLSDGIPLSIEDMKSITSTPSLQQEFIIDDLLIRRGRCLIYGKPKRGKTNLALFIALLLASKKEVFGKKTVKQSVLYITTEQSAIALADRISKMATSLGVNSGFNLYYLEPKERNSRKIGELIELHKPSIVFVDCLYNLIGETNDQKVIHTWLTNFDSLIIQYKITLVIIHHRRKQGQRTSSGEQLNDITDEIMGSGFFGMWANLIIGVAKEDFSSDIISIGFVCRDSKGGMEDLQLLWNRNKCVFDKVEKVLEKERPNLEAAYRKEIVAWMKANTEKFATTTRLVEAARDMFEGRRGWRSMPKYWDCWNTTKNELEFDEWAKTHPQAAEK